jgi:hypothetical protein
MEWSPCRLRAIVALPDQPRRSLLKIHVREYAEESGYRRHGPAIHANRSCTVPSLSLPRPRRRVGRPGLAYRRHAAERQKNHKEARASEINVLKVHVLALSAITILINGMINGMNAFRQEHNIICPDCNLTDLFSKRIYEGRRQNKKRLQPWDNCKRL